MSASAISESFLARVMEKFFSILAFVVSHKLYTISFCCFVIIAKILLDTRRRKKSSPNRPLLTCFLDSWCVLIQKLRIGPWCIGSDVNTSLQIAMNKTGLTDLGGSDKVNFIKRYAYVREKGLELCKAKYTPLGHVIACSTFQRRMQYRLMFVEYMKQNPHVKKIQLRQPIFVIGFPRTGTTYLHELLGAHEAVESHHSWEQMEPVPRTKVTDPTPEDMKRDLKLRHEANMSTFNMILDIGGDAIQSVHRIGYDEQEECTTPCAIELPWHITELPLSIFCCKEVINGKPDEFKGGAGETFEFYKQFLQLLQYQKLLAGGQDYIKPGNENGFTWMLKCPFHLPYLDEIYAAFPGATVVWTHRNPVDCIGSACSLYYTLMSMIMEESTIDKKAIGKAVLTYTELCLKKAFETFVKLEDKASIVHVKFKDTTGKPKEECQRICEKSGLEFSKIFEKTLDEKIAADKAERKRIADERKAREGKDDGKLHDYKLEDFGLNTAEVAEKFKDYIAKYC